MDEENEVKDELFLFPWRWRCSLTVWRFVLSLGDIVKVAALLFKVKLKVYLKDTIEPSSGQQKHCGDNIFVLFVFKKKILFRRYESFRLTTFSLIIITRFTFWQSRAPVNEHVD